MSDLDHDEDSEELTPSALDPAHVTALEGEHGRIAIVAAGGREWVLRRPKLAEADAFYDAVDGGGQRSAALRTLARQCLLPSVPGGTVKGEREAFQKLAETAPAAARFVASAALTLSVGEGELTGKRLPRG